MEIPILSSHVSNLLLMAPSAPTTTCTTSCCLIPHSFPISLFKSCYLSIFSTSFSYTLWFHGEVISTIIITALSLLFSNNVRLSGLNNTVTLYSHIQQYVTSLVFHHTILFFIIPFLTFAHYYVQFIKASLCKHITKFGHPKSVTNSCQSLKKQLLQSFIDVIIISCMIVYPKYLIALCI